MDNVAAMTSASPATEGFGGPLTISGPWRSPAQMLAAQEVAGHASVHDEAQAQSLGLSGAPIEGPTHFSQFDPLGVARWGERWFTHGAISAHFRTMVVQGEEVEATAVIGSPAYATISARKRDDTPVLEGAIWVGEPAGRSPVLARFDGRTVPQKLDILDRLEPGASSEEGVTSVDFETANGPGYPFSLAEKLERITEPHPWYTVSGAAASPWGRPILPMEMISVLSAKAPTSWPVRQPSLGLFLDLEIALLNGPLFVGQEYAVHRTLLGLGESRKTESMWTETLLTDTATGLPAARVVLHSGVFKASYPGHPAFAG